MATIEPTRELDELSPERIVLVRLQLKEVLTSHAFAGSRRAQDFLQLIVGHALEGQIDSLRERMIGAEMFGRPVGYDTANDPVVRVKASEVRKKLAQYYFEADEKPAVHIEIPSGSYVPRFSFAPLKKAAQEPNEATSVPSSEQADTQDERLPERWADSKVEEVPHLDGKNGTSRHISSRRSYLDLPSFLWPDTWPSRGGISIQMDDLRYAPSRSSHWKTSQATHARSTSPTE